MNNLGRVSFVVAGVLIVAMAGCVEDRRPRGDAGEAGVSDSGGLPDGTVEPDSGSEDSGGGVDAGPCDGMDCTSLGGECVVGMCDPTTDTCVTMMRPSGTTCDDGDPCTTDDACEAGSCTGTPVDCSALDGMCLVGTCDSTGACVAMPEPDGAMCDDGDPCTSDSCMSGMCESIHCSMLGRCRADCF